MSIELEDIQARRSVSPKRLGHPGPSNQQITEMVTAACAAPDHRRLHPWRFILIPENCRGALADLFEAAAWETHVVLTDDGVRRAREKAANGASLVAVIACIRPDFADVPEHEQWVSVGAALQNLLLAASGMGFSAMIVSGDKVGTRSLRSGFALTENETLLGFVAIGTPSKSPIEVARPTAQSVLTVWSKTP